MKINVEITKDRIVKTPSGKEFYLMEIDGNPEKRMSEVSKYLAVKSERIAAPELKEDTPFIMKMIVEEAPKEIRQSAYVASQIDMFLTRVMNTTKNKEIQEFLCAVPAFKSPSKYAQVLELYSKTYIAAAEFFTRIANDIKNNPADYSAVEEETPNGNIKIQ